MNRILSRLRGGESDAGVALVMVMGIMMVGAIILTTLAAVTMFNAQQTLRTRIAERALASADSGIDLFAGLLEGKKYNELNGVCSQTFAINSDTVSVATSYVVNRGGTTLTVACPLTTDITQSLTVSSTATTTAGYANADPMTKTVVATFTPTPPTVTLDKAIFSEATTTITNNMQIQASGVDASGNSLNDAAIYSNGGVTCNTQVNQGGSIYAAQGDVTLNDNCKVGNSVWASGKIVMNANSAINGDAYAAASDLNWGILMQNSGNKITGNALTNGGISLSDTYAPSGGIGGSAFARLGSIYVKNSTIGGSAYAAGTITLQDGNAKIGADAISTTATPTGITYSNAGKIGGNAAAKGSIPASNPPNWVISGTRTQNTTTSFPAVPNPAAVFPAAVGYPTLIQAPAREQMPKLTMSATDIAKWQASGWVVETYTNKCTGGNPASIINSGSWATGPRLIVFTGCSDPVSFENANMTLKGNLALVSATGFKTQNNNWFKSSTTDTWSLYMIVPADAAGVSWVATTAGQTKPSCSPSRDISFGTGIGFTKVKTILYTPCAVSWQNGLHSGSDPFIGQVYGGSVNIATAITLKMSTMSVPSLSSATPSATDPTKMNMAARFDLNH